MWDFLKKQKASKQIHQTATKRITCDVRLVFATAVTVTVIAGGDVVLTVDFVVEIGAVLTQARLAAFATGDLLPVVAVRVGRVQLVMCVLGRG